MPDRSMLVLYPASAAVSSVVSSCFIYELVKSTKLTFSRNTLLCVPSGNPRSETPHCLGIPVQITPPCLRNSSSKNPPCLQNSEKPPVGGYGYFLESPITRGNIVRSKATWYEKGEKNNKYFLGLEKSRNTKNCIWKLVEKHGQTVTNSKAIMAELKGFCKDLRDNKDSGIDNDDLQSFDQNLNITKLSDNLSLHCDGLLIYTECYKALEKFKSNK